MDTEPADEIVKKEEQKEQLSNILNEVMTPMQKVINDAAIDPVEGQLNVEKERLELLSKKSQWGSFAFYGKLLPDHMIAQFQGELLAQIQNIRIPVTLRQQGLGTNLVNIWEKELSERGVTNFIATNIKDEAAKHFWERRGYAIPPDHTTSNMPYYMYKVVSPVQSQTS